MKKKTERFKEIMQEGTDKDIAALFSRIDKDETWRIYSVFVGGEAPSTKREMVYEISCRVYAHFANDLSGLRDVLENLYLCSDHLVRILQSWEISLLMQETKQGETNAEIEDLIKKINAYDKGQSVARLYSCVLRGQDKSPLQTMIYEISENVKENGFDALGYALDLWTHNNPERKKIVRDWHATLQEKIY